MHISKEFIKGVFIYTDNKNASSFSNNRDEAFEHLTYLENKNYFDNLSSEDQKVFMNILYRRFLKGRKGKKDEDRGLKMKKES